MTVKLLLLDEDHRLLLVHGRDRRSGSTHWYPVGGGVEPGETLHEAARREAHEETGLVALQPGTHVWTRDHTYRYDGRTVEVHEDWSVHTVEHFDPVPAGASAYELDTVIGFRWWHAEDLATTDDTVFPPTLGRLLAGLLRDGPPTHPVDITDRSVG